MAFCLHSCIIRIGLQNFERFESRYFIFQIISSIYNFCQKLEINSTNQLKGQIYMFSIDLNFKPLHKEIKISENCFGERVILIEVRRML